nr:hypothetical protein [Tanacetum cinerariifolium]
ENIHGVNVNASVDGGVKSSGNGGAQIPKANIAATPTFSPTGLEFPTGIHSPASANEETSSASNVP